MERAEQGGIWGYWQNQTITRAQKWRNIFILFIELVVLGIGIGLIINWYQQNNGVILLEPLDTGPSPCPPDYKVSRKIKISYHIDLTSLKVSKISKISFSVDKSNAQLTDIWKSVFGMSWSSLGFFNLMTNKDGYYLYYDFQKERTNNVNIPIRVQKGKLINPGKMDVVILSDGTIYFSGFGFLKIPNFIPKIFETIPNEMWSEPSSQASQILVHDLRVC